MPKGTAGARFRCDMRVAVGLLGTLVVAIGCGDPGPSAHGAALADNAAASHTAWTSGPTQLSMPVRQPGSNVALAGNPDAFGTGGAQTPSGQAGGPGQAGVGIGGSGEQVLPSGQGAAGPASGSGGSDDMGAAAGGDASAQPGSGASPPVLVADEPVRCPGPGEQDLAVPWAGSGEVSGCTPRACAGSIDMDVEATYHTYRSDLTRFQGCTTVVGDVIVSDLQAADLRALACLENVTGSLIVWNSPALRSLDGLNSLGRVGRDLEIGQYAFLAVENPGLSRIDALSNLRTVGRNLTLWVSHVRDLDGLQNLVAVGGHVMIEGGLPVVTDMIDGVEVRDVAIRDLRGLSNLRWIGGGLQFGQGVASTAGMDALERIGQQLVSHYPRWMDELAGFPNLRCIGRAFAFSASDDPSPARIAGFGKLTYVGHDVRISDQKDVPELAILGALDTLEGGLNIQNNQALSRLVLPHVRLEPDAAVYIANNPRLSACEIDAWLASQRAAGWNGVADVSGNLPCVTPLPVPDPPPAPVDPPVSAVDMSAWANLASQMPGRVEQVALGSHRTCAIADGHLYCWGRDFSESGFGGAVGYVEHPVLFDDAAGWQAISLGQNSACGIVAGRLYCWGDNASGQLGVGDMDPRTTPTQVGDQADWAAVSVYRTTTCGVRESGALYCWGEADYGQLGTGEASGPPAAVPVRVDDASDWVSADPGDTSTCGLRGDQLYCWGRALVARAGDGASSYMDALSPLPVGGGWDAISVGDGRACGIRNGQLLCWGQTWFAWMNVPSTSSTQDVPTLAHPGSGWQAVALGPDQMCGIRQGVLYCHGAGAQGRLGQGDTADRYVPSPIAGPNDWDAVAVSETHACAVRDGHLYCWGGNTLGQLGVGDLEFRARPTAVDL